MIQRGRSGRFLRLISQLLRDSGELDVLRQPAAGAALNGEREARGSRSKSLPSFFPQFGQGFNVMSCRREKAGRYGLRARPAWPTELSEVVHPPVTSLTPAAGVGSGRPLQGRARFRRHRAMRPLRTEDSVPHLRHRGERTDRGSTKGKCLSPGAPGCLRAWAPCPVSLYIVATRPDHGSSRHGLQASTGRRPPEDSLL